MADARRVARERGDELADIRKELHAADGEPKWLAARRLYAESREVYAGRRHSLTREFMLETLRANPHADAYTVEARVASLLNAYDALTKVEVPDAR